jgi:hypothetical protein
MYRGNIKKPSKKKQSSKFFDKYMLNYPQNYLFTVSEPKAVRTLKRDIINLLMKDIAKGTVNYEKTAQYFTKQFVYMMYNVVLQEYNRRIMYSEVFKDYINRHGTQDQLVVQEADELIRSRSVYDCLYKDIELFYQSSEFGAPDFNILKSIPSKIKFGDAYLI